MKFVLKVIKNNLMVDKICLVLPRAHTTVIIISVWLMTQIWVKLVSQFHRKIGNADIVHKTCPSLDRFNLQKKNCKKDHQCTQLDRYLNPYQENWVLSARNVKNKIKYTWQNYCQTKILYMLHFGILFPNQTAFLKYFYWIFQICLTRIF